MQKYKVFTPSGTIIFTNTLENLENYDMNNLLDDFEHCYQQNHIPKNLASCDVVKCVTLQRHYRARESEDNDKKKNNLYKINKNSISI